MRFPRGCSTFHAPRKKRMWKQPWSDIQRGDGFLFLRLTRGEAPEFARVDAWFDEQFGAAGKTHRERFIANREDSTPYTLLVDSATELTFAKPARAIAQSLAETGKASWLYRFDVESGSDDFMSPHCFDLPFLFGNRTAWSDAPMLKAVDDTTYEKASLEFRSAVKAFLTGGEPKTFDGVPWSAFDPSRPMLSALSSTMTTRPLDEIAVVVG